ncbi:MAG: glycosyltransferase [Xenococcaceae cyanobacterium MO_207.B15]|nr:glycosyltransferase [Xenococcaceae cyanobacterium MO_207.B15]
MNKKPIIIFRNEMLHYSETFIPAQINSLSKYEPYYVGTKLIDTQQLGKAKVIVPFGGKSRIYRQLFAMTGYLWSGWLKRIKDIKAQLIHAHFGIDGVLALPIAQKTGLPLMVTFHGYDITSNDCSKYVPGWNYQTYEKGRRILFKEAQLFIAVSDFIRSKLIEKGCPEEKIVVHYIGIDTDKFKPDPTVNRKPVVLFVGRLTEKKGCEYLIRAMAQVQSVMPEVELVIIGNGILKPKLEELAAQLLCRYSFLGAQPPEVVRSWMNQSRLLAVPSVTAASGDTEGAPMVVLEAQAMGLPVVGSIHAGIPELVAEGETALLAKERDFNTLAQNITYLIKDTDFWQKLSHKGQERVNTNFNLHTQTQALEKIYDSLIAKENKEVNRSPAVLGQLI